MPFQWPWYGDAPETRAQADPTTPGFYEAQPETKTVSVGLGPEMSAFFKHGRISGATNPSSALQLYEDASIVAVPVNWIASAFAAIQPVLRDDETGELDTTSPVLDRLKDPGAGYRAAAFRKNLALNYLVTGEMGLAALGAVTRPPVELQPISPKDYDVKAGNSNMAETYTINGETLPGVYRRQRVGRFTRFQRDRLTEFVQFRNFSTKDNGLLNGQSPLISAAREVRQHILGGRHNVSVLEKGGRISLLFHLKADLKQDNFDTQAVRLENAFGGATEAGKILVTAGSEMDVKEIGTTAKDMDWKGLMEMARMAVALQYRIPLALVFLDATTLDNYKIAKLALYDDAVLPVADDLFDVLSYFLLPRYGLDPLRFSITYDPKTISALATRRLEQLLTRKQINQETTNELRADLGQEDYAPTDDPADKIMVSGTLVPLGESGMGGGGGIGDGLMEETPGAPDSVDEGDGE